MKFQLHPTALTMCPAAFEKKYIEGRYAGQYSYWVRGRAIDRAVTTNLKHKQECGVRLPDTELLDVARTAAVEEWESDEVMLSPDEKARGERTVKLETVDTVVRLGELHHREAAKEIEPLEVHYEWTLDVAPEGKVLFQLAGDADIVDVHGIRDTKSAKKTPAETAAQSSVQLQAYALAHQKTRGHYPGQCTLDFLVDKKLPEWKPRDTRIASDQDVQPFLNRVAVMGRMLETGLFPPINPDDWRCSAKFCPYWSECRYVRRPVTTSGNPDLVPVLEESVEGLR